MKKLAVLSGASSLKFFGKIYGTKMDYWVAQGKLPFEEEVPTDAVQEKRQEGVNSVVYWVTDDLLGDWV